MTSIGQRPTLAELIVILAGITKVEADQDALNSESKTFRVVLTFTRELMGGVPGWGEGQPTPSHAFDEIYSHLVQWQTQRAREAQWVSKEGEVASIDGLLAHYYTDLEKVLKQVPETVGTRVQKKVLSSTLLRLQELKERRAVGGVYNATESRREKARKAWAEDEFEAPNREKAQQEAHARAQGNQQKYQYNPYSNMDEETRRRAEEIFRNYHSTFSQFFYGPGDDWSNANPPPKASSGKRPWYEVLEVPSTATVDQIKKAYRKLAAKFHPDRYKGEDAQVRMAEINAARDERLQGL